MGNFGYLETNNQLWAKTSCNIQLLVRSWPFLVCLQCCFRWKGLHYATTFFVVFGSPETFRGAGAQSYKGQSGTRF